MNVKGSLGAGGPQKCNHRRGLCGKEQAHLLSLEEVSERCSVHVVHLFISKFLKIFFLVFDSG